MPSITKVLVIGAGGHGSEVVSYLHDLQRVSPSTILLGVIDDTKARGTWNSTEVLGNLRYIKEIAKSAAALHYITALGDNTIRKKVVGSIQDLGIPNLRPVSILHPSALRGANVTVGTGTLFAPNAIATTNVVIGEHCILNVKVSVSHDVILEDFVNLNPSCTIAGGCHIGEGAYIGAGASIIQNIRVGKWSTVGAGAVVIQDVPDHATVVGVPARELRSAPRLRSGGKIS